MEYVYLLMLISHSWIHDVGLYDSKDECEGAANYILQEMKGRIPKSGFFDHFKAITICVPVAKDDAMIGSGFASPLDRKT